ncbi:uncharacterized protein K452DRAFT_321669 [Aplosporella prunicola CBS 121167]|uniref:SET domain-containing protein n=1 Tax=Aplosporella prunicola CBS 121167 TaxID=1176127 RepID=A0A6A6B0S0_9PEZI|nr:uncharacterized protein K452DRAFT_321669 [Aplosporella prunicola CBS 121167]KAF2137630.1 hypothetical protein K452DRAFT_321669 [Aplosporella prunicola CBS 121167]
MAESKEQRINQLLSWFTENGGSVHPSVTFEEDSLGGIFAFAKEDIADLPFAVCTCPPKLQLSHLQAPEQLQEQLPEYVLSYFGLMKETILGDQSLWAPYIKCLPQAEDLTTPLYFKEEMTQQAVNEKKNDTAWLLGTNMDKAWRSREQEWKQEWEKACKIMESKGVPSKDYTWDLFKWAGTMFTSRCFPCDPGATKRYAVLVPVVDLLNHRFPTKVNWFFDNGAFRLSMEEPIRKGKELFNNYGGKSNEELLMGYGFCSPSHRCDAVAIRFGALPSPVVSSLESVLGSWDPSETHYVRGYDYYAGLYDVSVPDFPGFTKSGIPQTLWTVMEVLKKFQDSQVGPRPAWLNNDADNKPRAEWRSTLSARCDLLEVLATKYDNIDQYVDFLPDGPKNLKQTYAKMYRDGQLKVLKSNVIDLEDWILKHNFVTLEDAVEALKEENENIGSAWKQSLEELFETADLAILRGQEREAEVWTLWLTLAYKQLENGTASSTSRLRAWLADLQQSHPYNAPSAPAGAAASDPFAFSENLYLWAQHVVEKEARMLAYLDENKWSGKLVICVKEGTSG